MRPLDDLFAHAPDSTVAVIAEAGVNHNGDVGLAHRLIDIAADADAAAVKFQTFEPSALTAGSAGLTPYQKAQSALASQAEMLGQLMLPTQAWSELKAHADEVGIRFLSTPFDLRSAELLVDLGVDALKLSSGELTNLPYLRAVSGLGLPLLLSTGMGSRDEVLRAVDTCAAAPRLAVFHCVSAYPAPLDQCNLAAIPALHADLGLPVGWSDHTLGPTSAVAAVTVGARLLEKHFTTSRTLPGPDHPASLEPEELADYVAAAAAVPAMLGDGRKRRMTAEEENAPLVRRSWHTARAIPAGAVLTEADLIALRPEAGIPPTQTVVGRRLTRDLPAGEPLTAPDLEAGGATG